MSGRGLSTTLRIAAAAALAPVLASCDRTDPLAAPAIYYGEDVCAVCQMIISDERYAAAVIVDEGGVLRPVLFDDVGCLLGFEADAKAGIPVRYVRNAVSGDGSNGWLPMEAATYLYSRELRTPMAFGVAATGSRAEADRLAEDAPGDILDLEALRRRFERGELTIAPLELERGPDAPPASRPGGDDGS